MGIFHAHMEKKGRLDWAAFLFWLVLEYDIEGQRGTFSSDISLYFLPKIEPCPLCHKHEWLQKMWSLQLQSTIPLCYSMPPMGLYGWIMSYLVLRLGSATCAPCHLHWPTIDGISWQILNKITCLGGASSVECFPRSRTIRRVWMLSSINKIHHVQYFLWTS